MSNKAMYAIYDDDYVLLESAKHLVAKGIHIRDVFSPFPIHGLDPVIGLKRTRLAITAFIYGMIGVSLALLGLWYMMIQDWPLNIGGKPNFSLWSNIPAFVPVIFEFGVLCAAHGMAITYLLRNWTLPGFKAKNPYPRTTDDRFVMEIHASDSDLSKDEIMALINETCVLEIDEK
jgi:Alternative complex III, ActD subunit